MRHMFRPRAVVLRQRMQTASPNTRLRWAEWVLTASGLEDVFTAGLQWEAPILGVHDSVVRPLFLPGYQSIFAEDKQTENLESLVGWARRACPRVTSFRAGTQAEATSSA
jgi:hypothetical protein